MKFNWLLISLSHMWWLELFLVLKGRMWMVDRFVDVFEGGVDEELKWLPKCEGGGD